MSRRKQPPPQTPFPIELRNGAYVATLTDLWGHTVYVRINGKARAKILAWAGNTAEQKESEHAS